MRRKAWGLRVRVSGLEFQGFKGFKGLGYSIYSIAYYVSSILGELKANLWESVGIPIRLQVT